MALSRLRHPVILRARRLLAAAPSTFRSLHHVPEALNQIPDVDATSLRTLHFRLLSGVHGMPSKLQNGVRYFSSAVEEVSDDDYGNATAAVNVGPSIKATAVSQMEAATDALSRELAKLRTGRASAGMLDHIIVDTGGVKTPLCRMAVISVLDPKTLSVNPYDPNTLKELEKAIISSPLGLNPQSDNQRLIVPIPPLTKEHVQAVCKVVAKSSEDVKQSIRRARQKALDTIKKSVPKKKDRDKSASAFSEDDAKRLEKKIDDLTKKFIKSAEDMCKSKEKEITSS
ncbi:hypothetical protein RND71_021934 [Anisodus tanguticus]|uniref:Ribosome-recycling factor, chloroplastic n=1 Tax=Anisodus tanguticus TaxID=243964 RepID=A0AAE1RXG7_9SOLA|nr:hypothetical protein RND71_021934 [Anisodus tanguticus]